MIFIKHSAVKITKNTYSIFSCKCHQFSQPVTLFSLLFISRSSSHFILSIVIILNYLPRFDLCCWNHYQGMECKQPRPRSSRRLSEESGTQKVQSKQTHEREREKGLHFISDNNSPLNIHEPTSMNSAELRDSKCFPKSIQNKKEIIWSPKDATDLQFSSTDYVRDRKFLSLFYILYWLPRKTFSLYLSCIYDIRAKVLYTHAHVALPCTIYP